MEERIKRTGNKEIPPPTKKQPALKAKERSANDKPSKAAKEPNAQSTAKSVDALDAPKPDLAALKALARPQ